MELQISPVHSVHMPKKANNPPPRHFLRKWRQHRKMSLESAAHAIGISHASLGRIERGVQDYTGEYLEALAWLYKCTPLDLLGTDPTRVREPV